MKSVSDKGSGVTGSFVRVVTALSMIGVSFDVRAQPAAATQPAASAQPRIIVFEAQVGEPALAETMLLGRLRDELETLGLVARPETLLKTVGGRVPRPGISDPDVTLEEISRLVETGHSAFTQGDFDTAIELLTKAKRLIKRNPALLVLDTGNSDMVVQAYASLGFSQNKRKPTTDGSNRNADRPKVVSEVQDPLRLTPEAEATLSELMRMYPSLSLPHDYGPIAERTYRALQRRVFANGHGRLLVHSKNEHALIFVDQQMRGMGAVKPVELPVGGHQVFSQLPGSGRRYEVEIKANEDTVLDIEPKIHTALWVSDLRVWFQFTSETERTREATFSGALARDWRTGETVVVIGAMAVQGKPAIIGTVYRLNGEAARPTAFVAVEQAGTASIHALALYLAEGRIGTGIRLITHGGPSDNHSSTSDDTEGRHSTLLTKIVLGSGALLVAGGAVIYVTSKADDFTQPTYNDIRSPAVDVMSTGSVVLGAGVFLWLRDTRASSTLTSALVGGGFSAMVSGGMLYVTDEDLHHQGYQRKTFRNTAALGAVLGWSGVGLAGVGTWLLYRESKARSSREAARMSSDARSTATPILSISSSHAFVGWTGRF